eukprot:2619964-Rhodomonas_salina.1
MAAASARSEQGGAGICLATGVRIASLNTTPAPMVSSPSALTPTLPSVAATTPGEDMYCVPWFASTHASWRVWS